MPTTNGNAQTSPSLNPQGTSASFNLGGSQSPTAQAAAVAAPTPTPAVGSSPTSTLPPATNLDPQVIAVAQTIKQIESQGNYNSVGDNGSSMGAYQWNNGGTPIAPGQTPLNWQNAAKQFLGDANAPMTPANQNYVAYQQIAAYKAQGLSPNSIDALWNGASPDPNNPGQYVHNNSQRATLFQQTLQQYAPAGGGTQTPQTNNGLPTYGATFPAMADDNGLVLGLKALGNIPSSLYGLGAGLLNIVEHPIQTVENLGSAAIGGVENLTGENQGTPDQYQQVANNLGNAIMQRYGSLDALKNTLTDDPAGAALDLATIITGGEGIAAKGADLADLAAGTTASTLGEGAQYGQYGSMVRSGISSMNDAALSTLGKAASPVTSLGRKLVNATLGGGANEETLAAAARTGVTLPAMAYSDNPLIQFGETMAAKGAGEAAYTARVESAVEGMNKLAENIVASTGGETDPAIVGASIVKGMNDLEAAHEAANSALYNELEAQVGDVAAHTDTSTGALNKMIASQESLGETANVGYFKNKLAVLNGAKAEPYVDADTGEVVSGASKYPAPTYSTLKQLRTLLGQKIKNFNDPIVASNKADLIKLYGALSQDMRSTLLAQEGGEGLAAQWDKANLAYADSVDMVKSQYAKTIQRLSTNGQESKILSTLFKPSMAQEDIPRIMDLAGPKGAANIRAAFTKELLDSARDPTTGNFAAGKIDRVLAKYGDAKIGAILQPQQIQQIKDLGTLSDAMKGVLNLEKGSSPGFMARMALSLRTLGEPAAIVGGAVRLFSGDLVGGISLWAGALGYEGLSRFFASDIGNRLLQWGALHGSEFAQTAQTEGLTTEALGGTMGVNDNFGTSGGGGTSALGGNPESAISNVASPDSNATGPLSKLGNVAKKVAKNPQYVGSLVNLAQQNNFDLQGAQNAGYSDAEIQNFLQPQS